VCVLLGAVAVLLSPLWSWAGEGNLSSMPLLRALELATSDAVNVDVPLLAVTWVVVGVLVVLAATAGWGGRWFSGVRIAVALLLVAGVVRVMSDDMFGSGTGTGLALALGGCVAIAVGGVVGLRVGDGASELVRWSPPVVAVIAVGIFVGGAVLSAGLGADDADTARDGLVAAIEAGDVVAAATYLSPNELVTYGGVALGVDALAGVVGFDPLTGDRAPGRLVSTVLGVGVRLLPTEVVDGRTYVVIEVR
jgi:hypothetical protein